MIDSYIDINKYIKTTFLVFLCCLCIYDFRPDSLIKYHFFIANEGYCWRRMLFGSPPLSPEIFTQKHIDRRTFHTRLLKKTTTEYNIKNNGL